MIKKNIKSKLFVSLIAAMILSLSLGNIVYADSLYGSSCSSSSAYNTVFVTATIASQQQASDFEYGYGCAWMTVEFQASDRPQPSYIWYVNGVTNAWNP